MRFIFLLVTCFCGLLSFAKDTPGTILASHNDIKGPIIGFTHTEDFDVFRDGRVRYSESGNDRKTGTFSTRLTPAELHRLTVLLNSIDMRAVPAEIPSQIKVVDFDWEAQLHIRRSSGRQNITIKNFYPMLNTQRPAYPTALIQVECMLRDLRARATKRPVPAEDQDWCPEKTN